MDWDIQRGGWKDVSPIGRQVERFILENPQYFLYFRRFPQIQCPEHWDVASGAPKFLGTDCPKCWGFGLKTEAQLVPGRISFGPGNVGAENSTKSVPGYVEYFTAVLHLPRAIKPELDDVVCSCEWNKPTQLVGKKPLARVLKLNSVYQIKTINDYFERELSFYSCGLEIYDVHKKTLDQQLSKLVDTPIIEVTKSWPQNFYW